MAGKAVGVGVPVIMLLVSSSPVVRGVGGVSDSARRRSAGHSSCATETATHSAVLSLQVQFLEVLDMPVVAQRQVRAPARVDKVVNIPVESQRLIPMTPSVQKTGTLARWSMSLLCWSHRFSGAGCGVGRRLPQLQLAEKIVAIRQFLDKVVACLLVCNNRCLA